MKKTLITSRNNNGNGDGVSDGQKRNLVNLMVAATVKSVVSKVNELSKEGILNRHSCQYVLAGGHKLAKETRDVVGREFGGFVENGVGRFRPLFNDRRIIIPATTGKEFLSKSKVFTTNGREFSKLGCDVEDYPTKEVEVKTYEILKGGVLMEIFGGFGVDFSRSFLNQGQIISVVENHRFVLGKGGMVTLFLFRVGSKFLVLRVSMNALGLLGAHVSNLLGNAIYYNSVNHQVVVPQLNHGRVR
ncbi:MAG: hypothetical protein WCS89_04255 [Candidatus Paceibacterota bacterium]|jgi:hypothetical protein